jgi:hypothetical protein
MTIASTSIGKRGWPTACQYANKGTIVKNVVLWYMKGGKNTYVQARMVAIQMKVIFI